MINEIIKFENIGTPNYMTRLVNIIYNGSYNKNTINHFFINKMIDDRTVFDGGLFVLQYIGFVEISSKKILYIPKKYDHFLKNDKTLQSKIILMFIDMWALDDSFSEIFNRNTVLHDVEHNSIVGNKAFKFKYSKLKQLLIDFNVLTDSVTDDHYRVTNQYKKYFDKKVVKQVKFLLSLSEFKKIQDLKNKAGEEAEIFVLNFEKQKFKGHDLINAIEQMSIIDSSAGYDIASIISSQSDTIDKFIEVKSYSNRPSFYWTKNEIEVAKQEQDNYFLYLVDREQIHDSNYQPLIIQNPYENVFDKYQKECQSWKFELSNNI